MSINVNMTKMDVFNAKNASLAIPDVLGETLIVSGCAVDENGGKSQSGEPCDVGYIATDKGVVGFTSNVCLKSMDGFSDILSDALSDGVAIGVTFFESKTKSGKPFYNFRAFEVK